MRYLLLIAVAAVLFGGAGCSMFPGTDDASERQFWGPELPREILGMEAKPTETAPAGTQPLTPDRTHGGVR